MSYDASRPFHCFGVVLHIENELLPSRHRPEYHAVPTLLPTPWLCMVAQNGIASPWIKPDGQFPNASGPSGSCETQAFVKTVECASTGDVSGLAPGKAQVPPGDVQRIVGIPAPPREVEMGMIRRPLHVFGAAFRDGDYARQRSRVVPGHFRQVLQGCSGRSCGTFRNVRLQSFPRRFL